MRNFERPGCYIPLNKSNNSSLHPHDVTKRHHHESSSRDFGEAAHLATNTTNITNSNFIPPEDDDDDDGLEYSLSKKESYLGQQKYQRRADSTSK